MFVYVNLKSFRLLNYLFKWFENRYASIFFTHLKNDNILHSHNGIISVGKYVDIIIYIILDRI